MLEETLANGNVFKRDESWSHVVKKINLKTYVIEYNIVSGFKNKEEALESYRKEEAKYKKGIDKIKKLTDMPCTFVEYLDSWYQDSVVKYSNSSNQAAYFWVIYKIIHPNLKKDVLIGNISDLFINDLIDSCKGYSKSAAETTCKVLRIVLKDAIASGLVKESVLTGMKTYYSKPQKTYLYNKGQIKTFLAAAKQYHSCYLEILLALFCGLRTGEILGLKYTDFSYNEKTVTIERQYTCDYKYEKEDMESQKDHFVSSNERSFKPPKTINSKRCLTVPDCILKELSIRRRENKELLKKGDYKNCKSYICLGKKSIKSEATFNAALRAITKSCGLPRITMHTLRHMCATLLIENGVPIEKISKILGHKRVSTTFDIYCGLMDAEKQITDTISETMDPAISIRNPKEAM